MITINKKPPIVALCDNPMFFRITTDLPSGTEDISVYLDPYYFALIGGEFLGRDVLYPAPMGSAETDLSDYLRAGLQQTKEFHFPEQGNATWHIRPNLCKQYKILIQENARNYSFNTSLEQRYVVRGKIPKWKKNAFYKRWNSFLQWITADKAFLTFSPNTLTTRKEQYQKLYFLVYWSPDSGIKLNLKVNLYFNDATTAVYFPNQQTADVARYNIIEFSTGYSTLGIGSFITANHPGKVLESYDVAVMNSSEQVSQTKTYLMDYKPNLAEHQFIFANSLPGYDTFLATGIFELRNEYEYFNADQQSPGTLQLPNKKTGYIKSEEFVTARTGYVSAETMNWLAELFESKEVYEIIDNNLFPVVFHNTKILRKKDSTNVYYAEFEYEYATQQYLETE